ncbi:MAG: D-glycerate dehydrogenase [Anaerolineae bacterium]|nr:D-glycerate dehydrogenase [Anaerolineae bacterium]MDW8100267.1 D-glycerate dehydrogenase [Anaerolineae bacterium]
MPKPKVYVTRLIPEEGLQMILEACDAEVWEGELPPPREVLLEKVKGRDGLLSLLTDQVDATLMDAAGSLRVISNYAVGYDNIDVQAATERGIPVGNTPGVLTETTADLAFALLMAVARRVVEGVDYVRAGRWKTWGPRLLLGQDVHGATLGIIGFGRIGQAMARRARGFDMRVLYYDRTRREGLEASLGVSYADLDTLLREADFVSIHTDLNPSTYHLMNAEALAKMKRTAILINTARGPIVDPAALAEALERGIIAGAGLDVTEPEPIPLDSPLLKFPNCVIVPHIASASVATRGRMARMAAENLLAGLRGERLPHCVNPEVYERKEV